MSCRVGFNMGDGWHRAQRRRGDLMLVPPGVEVAYRVDGPCRLLVLTWPAGSVRALDAERFLAEASLFSPLYGRLFRSEVVLDLAQRIFRALNTGGLPARLLLDGALAALAGLLADHADGVGRRPEPALRIAPTRLRRATELIEASLDRDLDLAEIAAAAGLSPYHFSRVFKAATGSSPYRYLTERRIERACSLLHGGNSTIAEVATEVGFSSQSRFTHAFRRLVGLTPGAWRRRSRGGARPVEPSARRS